MHIVYLIRNIVSLTSGRWVFELPIVSYKHITRFWREEMNKALIFGLILSFNSLATHVALNSNGLGVYDTETNITWTTDANLLGTLESTNGYANIVNAVIAATV